MPRVVLVTGVSRDLAARFVRALCEADPRLTVLGVDVLPPRHDLGRAAFVRADIRNPVVATVIDRHQVDTVVHMAMVASPGAAAGRASMKEMNVIGTMQLLAACQHSPAVHTVVVQSSISVYGASWRDPARFTEDMRALATPRTGFGKDSIEVESYVRGLARRRGDITVTVLRLANLMGAGVETAVTRLFSLPVVPRLMGFDPRLQFLHPDDAVAALRLATEQPRAGTFNVGADGVVTLSQALRMLGRPWVSVPSPVAPLASLLLRQARLVDFSADQIDALTFGRVMDTGRFTAEFGFIPRWTSRQAVADFAASVRPGLLGPDRIERLRPRAGRAEGGHDD